MQTSTLKNKTKYILSPQILLNIIKVPTSTIIQIKPIIILATGSMYHYNFNRFFYRSYHCTKPTFSPFKIGHVKNVLHFASKHKPLPPSGTLTITPTSKINGKAEPVSQLPKDISIKSTISFLDQIIPKPNYGSIISESNTSTTSGLKTLLKTAEEWDLIEYENTKEYPNSGALRLTQEGIKFSNIPTLNSFSDEFNVLQLGSNYSYKVIILNIDSNTVIPTPTQMHLVVAINLENNYTMAIGILTSEKQPNHIQLSATQPLCGNIDKEQLFRPLQIPLKIRPNLYEVHLEATTYVNSNTISKILDLARTAVMKKAAMDYHGAGITENKLRYILENAQAQAQEKITSKQKKQENFLTKENDLKAAKSKKAVELNKLKQKDVAQKQKVSAQQQQQNQKESTQINIPKDDDNTI